MRWLMSVLLCAVCVTCLAFPDVATAQSFDGWNASTCQNGYCGPSICQGGQCYPGAYSGSSYPMYANQSGWCRQGNCQPFSGYQQYPSFSGVSRSWHTSSAPAWGSFRRW